MTQAFFLDSKGEKTPVIDVVKYKKDDIVFCTYKLDDLTLPAYVSRDNLFIENV